MTPTETRSAKSFSKSLAILDNGRYGLFTIKTLSHKWLISCKNASFPTHAVD